MTKHPEITFAIESTFRLLDKETVTPWVFLPDKMPQIKDSDGRLIHYEGVKFEGSPQQTFWSGFIEPFLEEIIGNGFRLALDYAKQRGVDSTECITIAQQALRGGIVHIYRRMQDIDRRLRGGGFPTSLLPRDIANEIRAMHSKIDQYYSSAEETAHALAEKAPPVAQNQPTPGEMDRRRAAASKAVKHAMSERRAQFLKEMNRIEGQVNQQGGGVASLTSGMFVTRFADEIGAELVIRSKLARETLGKALELHQRYISPTFAQEIKEGIKLIWDAETSDLFNWYQIRVQNANAEIAKRQPYDILNEDAFAAVFDDIENRALASEFWDRNDEETDDETRFMREAIEQARQSKTEDSRSHPQVGVVVVKDGTILGVACRGEFAPGEHAEYTVLERKLPEIALAGSTVYTTLEPCTTRSHPKVPCAERLIERKVAKVVIGMLDPNPAISGKGQIRLREANIATELFPAPLMAEIEELNRNFRRAHNSKRIEPQQTNQTGFPSLQPWSKELAIRRLKEVYDEMHTWENLKDYDKRFSAWHDNLSRIIQINWLEEYPSFRAAVRRSSYYGGALHPRPIDVAKLGEGLESVCILVGNILRNEKDLAEAEGNSKIMKLFIPPLK